MRQKVSLLELWNFKKQPHDPYEYEISYKTEVYAEKAPYSNHQWMWTKLQAKSNSSMHRAVDLPSK